MIAMFVGLIWYQFVFVNFQFKKKLMLWSLHVAIHKLKTYAHMSKFVFLEKRSERFLQMLTDAYDEISIFIDETTYGDEVWCVCSYQTIH